jgi:hypothetical protein
MYSSLSSTTDTMNSGGLTHCFPSFDTEHLSGSINEIQRLLDIKIEK